MSENLDVLAMLDEYAKHEEKAFSHYRRQYARENPPPKRPPWYTGFPWSTLPFAVIALAGSLLSALRTGPVFIEIASLTVDPMFAVAEGILAMLAVDMAVVAFRFILVMLQYRGRETEASITRWVRFGFWFAFCTQLTAQLYAVRGIASLLNDMAPALELAIALAAALSGMILAFVTGEILAVLVLQSQASRKEAKAIYREGLDSWRESLKKSWNKSKSKFGVEPPPELATVHRAMIATEKQPALLSADNVALSADKSLTNTNESIDKSLTWDRLKPSEQEVAAYYRQNPEDLELTIREAAEKIGSNTDAVSKARRFVSAELSANGSGKH